MAQKYKDTILKMDMIARNIIPPESGEDLVGSEMLDNYLQNMYGGRDNRDGSLTSEHEISDAWGNKFIVVEAEGVFSLKSKGEDGILNSADDIAVSLSKFELSVDDSYLEESADYYSILVVILILVTLVGVGFVYKQRKMN